MLENVQTTGGVRPTGEITTGEMPAETDTAEYARVELMGHRERVGRIQEVTRFGAALLRVDFWDHATQDMATELYSGGSIYCLSPCSKAVVDAWEEKQKAYYAPRPRQLPAPDDIEDDEEAAAEADYHRDRPASFSDDAFADD